MKRALITGITGQDGSFLAELLLEKGYKVYGFVRRTATPNTGNIDHLLGQVTLIQGDLLDQASIDMAVIESGADEIYNLAAQSFVGESWKYPIATAEQTALGATRLLEAIRRFNPKARYYQASTSEMFGNAPAPQGESTPFAPRSPYGVSKLYAHFATINYRESYDTFAATGILFNHESERRGLQFVTRKITDAVARIKAGTLQELRLGNLEAKRDWGFAGDYVKAMWKMLQQETPQDYVIGTGTTHSIKDFLEAAFSYVDLDWQDYVVVDQAFFRPAEVNELRADPSKAERDLDWFPETSFEALVHRMVEADLDRHSVPRNKRKQELPLGHDPRYPLG